MTESNEPRELLPCPFCGSADLSHGWSSPGYDGSMHSGSVECHECGALIIAGTEADAIAAWNHRTATEAASAKEVGELVAELSAMTEHYVQLAGCGDCGHWNPEEEPKVISARALLAKHQHEGEG